MVRAITVVDFPFPKRRPALNHFVSGIFVPSKIVPVSSVNVRFLPSFLVHGLQA